MWRALAIVVIGCGSSAPAPPPSATPSATTATPTVATDASTQPVRPLPAGAQGVEILVANAAGASDLVVTDEYLYAIEGKTIVRAPHARGATSSVLFDNVLVGNNLIRSGERLVWAAEMNSIYTALRTGGTPAKLVELTDYPSSIVDAGGLVAGAYVPGERRSRVVRISETGEITELAKLEGEAPAISMGVNGDLFVATISHSAEYQGVVGRIVDGRVEAVRGLRGATLLAADGDGLYCVVNEGTTYSLLKVTAGAKEPVRIAKGPGSITAVALDDRYIYWAEFLPEWMPGANAASPIGKLSRMAKAGGTPQPLRVEVGQITHLVVHGPDLYWSDQRKNVIARIRR
jgi:hypothetical protein